MADDVQADVQSMVQSLLEDDAAAGMEPVEPSAEAVEEGSASPPVEAPEPEAEQTEEVEATAEVAQDEAETETGPASKGWAAVKKHEKRLREERERFKEERAAFQAQMKQAEAAISEAQRLHKALNENPLELFKDNPKALRHLLERVVNDGAPGTTEIEDKTTAKLQELERKQQEWETRQEQAKVQEYDRQYRSGIEQVLKADEYKLLTKMPNANAEIYNLALAYAEETRRETGTPQIISPQEAAAAILDAYKKQLRETYSAAEVREILGETSPSNVTSIKDAKKPLVTGKTPPARKPVAERKLSDDELLDAIFNDVKQKSRKV